MSSTIIIIIESIKFLELLFYNYSHLTITAYVIKHLKW